MLRFLVGHYQYLMLFFMVFNQYLFLFRGFLIRGASRLAGFCVVRVFAGGIFNQPWLIITNHLISCAYNKIILRARLHEARSELKPV